jgi:hypothetical protein
LLGGKTLVNEPEEAAGIFAAPILKFDEEDMED